MPTRILLAVITLAAAAGLATASCSNQAQDPAAQNSGAGVQALAGSDAGSGRVGVPAGAVEQGDAAPPAGTPDTSGLAAGTADVQAVATWMPRGSEDLGEETEIAQYVHNLLGTDIVWSEQYARRTTWDDIEWLTSGGTTIPKPDLSGDPNVPDEQVHWIVGFRSPDPIPVERIGSFMGQALPSEVGQVGPPGTSVYEAYYVVDVDGNIARIGAVDTPTEDGGHQPNETWAIEDIAALREVAR